MNTMNKANDLSRLRSMTSFWGEIFTGTKAQLNAAGFGVGCPFPGEPGCGKRRCKIPVVHGFAKVEVHVEWIRKHVTSTPFENRCFEVWCHYLASDIGRYAPPSEVAPGIVLRRYTGTDAYTGTAKALIQAGLIEEYQLPGMPGCGKHTTSFDAEGNILKRGSTDWNQQGFRSVRKNGTKFCVEYCLSKEETELRKVRDREDERAYEARCLQAKYEKEARQSAPRPRPALRLVWSV